MPSSFEQIDIKGLGTAGTPDTGVVTVQGVSGGTAVPISDGGGSVTVDGTVGISGTVTVSGSVSTTISGVAQDSTLTGGTAKTVVRGGQKGTTNTNADITHTASGSNHEALDVAIYDASGNHLGTSSNPIRVNPTGATAQPVSGTVDVNLKDGTGNSITSTSNAIDVNIKSGASSGAVAQGSSTSGQTGGLAQAATTTSAPTYTNGTTNPLSLTTGGELRVDGSSVTQPISASSLPLPTGAATETTLLAVKTAIQAQLDLAATLWTDDSGSFYLRRDVVDQGTGSISVAFTDPSGTTATPGAGLRPASTSQDLQVINSFFDATSGGTGYSSGDLIARIVTLNAKTSPPTVVVSSWLNLTTGAILGTPPSSANIVEQTQDVKITSPLPSGTNLLGKVGIDQTTPGTTNKVSIGSDGTVTANIGTTNGVALDATLTGGSQKTKLVDSAGSNVAVVTGTGALKVDGSASTQPVSISSLPLPSGAATDSNINTAVGAAGDSPPALSSSASGILGWLRKLVDVVNSVYSRLSNGEQVSKIVDSGGTNVATVSAAGAVKVDGSAVTQPISGTVTSNIGTTNGLALDSTLTGGSAKSVLRGGQKGSTNTNEDITHTPSGANHQALDVAIYDSSGNQIGVSSNPFRTDPTGTTTQPISGTVTANAGTGTFAMSAASLPLPTGASTSAKQPSLGTSGSASSDVITVQGIAGMTPLLVDGTATTQPVSISTLPAGSNVIGKVSIDQSTPGTTNKVDIGTSGSVTAKQFRGSSTSVTQIAAATSSTTLLSSNSLRVKAVIVNDASSSTNTLYIKEGTGVTGSSYTYRLSQYDTLIVTDYTGVLTGVWASTSGSAMVSETSE